jgi:hypothetical protein
LRGALTAIDRATVSHDPGESGPIELLRDGLTFDLSGLEPDSPSAIPPLRHQFDCPDGLDPEHCEAIVLVPGPHLVSGASNMPVIRTQAALAADLAAGLPGALAIAWGPSASLIGPAFFASSIAAWLGGGAFPTIGLTAFASAPDGGLHSEGLAYFTGQELRLEPELAEDRVSAAQLAVRLVDRLIAQPPVTAEDRVIGPDGGSLALAPSANGRFVRVKRA